MAAKISNWLGTRSHRSHLSGALIERLSEKGQGGRQKWEVLDRAAARVRGRIAGTMADVVDKAPQSIIGRSALPGKKEIAGN